MTSRSSLFTVVGLVCCAALLGHAQEREGRQGGRGGGRGGRGQAAPIHVATDKVTPEIPGIVKAGTKEEIIETGLRGSDAGVGLPDGSFIFTANGGVQKIDPAGKMSALVEDSEQGAGLAMDSKGRIFAAQYTKKVSVVYPKESAETLTSNFEGKPYIRPNDLAVDKKGGVYFTDCYQVNQEKKPDDLPQAVYYITPAKKVIRVADDVRRPNGIVLSPDEKKLIVNDWDSANLVSYDVQRDGTLKNRKNFGTFDTKQETDHGLVSGADGLCIDGSGNTYATTPAGVQVFDAKGKHLGNIDAPYDMPPQNCGFAGPGKGYLYVTGRGTVWRVKTLTSGIKNRGK